ncbi:iron-siderophore ABC transporter substrate-binding protein [Frigoribacterium sp. Leaf44]|jgi:iron complex transport system substrate-binding protein|uniref:iron-siderophore ABC transporter substrate-binding protein n=1 Tax=Frigoribacterium sp. Leaf44 TaxID=1736220 RepID=UPI0006FCCF55|nr:iron-siderophore ABC transporter substrate-binding protein [Frigoribacterium sp. Leaf44]KQN41021.1 ABC transporter substrate-binding protein [Frigoribacterium sp. Leaf44]
MRKKLSIAAAVAVATLALAGCSADTDSDDATGGASGGSGAFPVSIDTKFGEVTVEKKPTRVVALGWGDAEAALALGVQPVGASDWLAFGDDADGVGPWAQGLYDQAPEIIGTLEPSYEAIAALEPDVILDTKSSGDQERYDRLSSIAPTVGVPEGGDSYLTDFEDQMELVSKALGEEAEGERLVDENEKAVEAVADAHPEWKGKTITAATKTSEGWGAYVEDSERVEQLEALGFEQNPAISALKPNAGGFSVSISSEQLDQIDADVIVAFPIYIDTTEITDDPQWKALSAVQDGHAVVIDGDVAAAYSLGSALSRQYALDQLVPLLEGATK